MQTKYPFIFVFPRVFFGEVAEKNSKKNRHCKYIDFYCIFDTYWTFLNKNISTFGYFREIDKFCSNDEMKFKKIIELEAPTTKFYGFIMMKCYLKQLIDMEPVGHRQKS